MTYKFSASHITGGNVVFPDKLEIDDEKVTFYKARLIGYATTIIQRNNIGSVSLKAGLLFADIIIETNGGQVTQRFHPLRCQTDTKTTDPIAQK